MSSARLNGAILISGRGSNMQALVRAAQQDPDYPVNFTHVLSDQPDAPGLAWAISQGLEVAIIDPKDGAGINKQLTACGAQIVCLAGYMRVLPPEVTDFWAGRMLNIHPSLLPKHKGLNAQAKALAAGDAEAGASVHFVSAELDGGDIVMQRAVPVLAEDSVESLSARILAVEHQIFPAAVQQVATTLAEAQAA